MGSSHTWIGSMVIIGTRSPSVVVERQNSSHWNQQERIGCGRDSSIGLVERQGHAPVVLHAHEQLVFGSGIDRSILVLNERNSRNRESEDEAWLPCGHLLS